MVTVLPPQETDYGQIYQGQGDQGKINRKFCNETRMVTTKSTLVSNNCYEIVS